MAISKTLKFTKTDNGVVLLQNILDSSLVASFEPSMSIVRENGEPFRFRISSSTDEDGFLLDYRSIDSALCSPVIVEANINEFLTELSRSFFFLDRKIKASDIEGLTVFMENVRFYPAGTLQVFKRLGNIDKTKIEVNDFAVGIVEGQFIKAVYTGGLPSLLVSFDVYDRIEF